MIILDEEKKRGKFKASNLFGLRKDFFKQLITEL